MLSVGVRARLSLLARQLDWSQRSVNALNEKLNLAAASVNEMPPAVPRAVAGRNQVKGGIVIGVFSRHTVCMLTFSEIPF